MEKLKKVCEMKHDLINWLHRDIHECCDLSNTQVIELAGEVSDVIKDLSEVELNCWKSEKERLEAIYYATVIEAMENKESEGPYGYNSNRYASGRYAPKGHGNMTVGTSGGRHGYRPFMDQEPYVDAYLNDPEFKHQMTNAHMMGYQDDGRMPMQNSSSKYGDDYENYRMARRHYTETSSPSDKATMDRHAMNHVEKAMDTMRDIYGSSDSEHKKQLKAELTKLVSEMPV